MTNHPDPASYEEAMQLLRCHDENGLAASIVALGPTRHVVAATPRGTGYIAIREGDVEVVRFHPDGLVELR